MTAELLFETPWFRVVRARGHTAVEDVGARTGAAVLALTGPPEDRRVVLVRIYRPTLDETVWELPRGAGETHEVPVTAALRELLEETGYVAGPGGARFLGAVSPNSGTVFGRVRVVVVPDAVAPAAPVPLSEGIAEVAALTAGQVAARIADGSLTDAFALGALAFAAVLPGPDGGPLFALPLAFV